ncbi:MAG: class D sortase [Bryobacteraceae bacterium]|jgi:sortase A
MRLIVANRILRTLKWAQRALFACAVLLLGYCGFALADTWIFQRRETMDLDRLLSERRSAAGSTAQPEFHISHKGVPAAAMHGLIGRIEIPRLLFSAIVVEGVDSTNLRRAVGHIPGTALPGEPGNVGLAGHRDTFFRTLKDLGPGDEIQLSTPGATFKYVVELLVVVEPDNVGVLAPSAENVLTLVTCYPFSYIGAAPRRWIVRARQVSPPSVPPSGVE